MTDLERPSHDPTADDADTAVHRTVDAATITETSPTPIATTAVGGTGDTGDGLAVPLTLVKHGSRMRWIAAGVVVALVVGVSAIATLSLTGSSPNATVLGYVPADSVAYGEVRMDLPGDQARKLGEFLSKFPGFADQAAIETKVREALDQLVSSGTDGVQTYGADIEPWFEGELAFAVGPIPAAGAMDDPMTAASAVRALLLISIKDEALARAWFTDAFGEAGVTGTTEAYNGTDLTVFGGADMGGVEAAFGIIGGTVVVAGDLASVKAAVDTRGQGALTDEAGFSAALAATESDHVGFIYVDLRSLMDAALELSASMSATAPMSDKLLAMIPEWGAFQLRIEGDGLVMDVVSPHVEAAPGPSENDANGVAAFAPASTLLLGAGNDYGVSLVEMMALYQDEPSMTEGMEQLEQALGAVGGIDAAVGWMGDTGFVVSQAGDTVEGGLISIPTDAADAEQLLTAIGTFITLGGGEAGIEVRKEEYAGTTITIVDLGSAEELLGMAGMMGGLPLDPGSMPGLPTGNVEISYAATADVVVIGSGPNFVKAVLDAGAGDSLADSARYRDLVARVGANHVSVSFVDITAIRVLAEGFLDEATAEQRAEYEESVKPFLEPFDALIAANVVGGGLDAGHIIITVK